MLFRTATNFDYLRGEKSNKISSFIHAKVRKWAFTYSLLRIEILKTIYVKFSEVLFFFLYFYIFFIFPFLLFLFWLKHFTEELKEIRWKSQVKKNEIAEQLDITRRHFRRRFSLFFSPRLTSATGENRKSF